ncbi:LacI family DNA-binding transcriptional regulator [Mediterraneibacter gnavus]|uniref:LacI family DNA-binding transcriptional regulator n=1 Tax=Mediterraneibacter gnavus TaxID=33038 RepID=UPI0036D2E38F
MATLKDVANLAGVSIATVSNYLNNTKPVSKEISKKIQDAVNELHYSINLNAKNLKSKINTDIGVILPRACLKIKNCTKHVFLSPFHDRIKKKGAFICQDVMN